MMQICEIKRILTAMKEVKDFDDNAYFDLVHDPRYGPDGIPTVRVDFLQNDIHVTLEAPVCRDERR